MEQNSTAVDDLNVSECEKAKAIRYDLILWVFTLGVSSTVDANVTEYTIKCHDI